MAKKNGRWTILEKAFKSATLSIAMIELSQTGAGLADSIITSRMLGSTCLSAVRIAKPVFTIVGVIGGVIALGCQTLASAQIGKGKYKEANKINSLGLIAAFVLSVTLMAILYVFNEPFIKFLGANKYAADLFEPARS